MTPERFTRSPAFRTALWAGLSAGPVLAILWPVFVRLDSGVWPQSPLALTLAMLTLGTLTGLAAALTLLLPLLAWFDPRPGPRLRWLASGGGALVCLVLVAGFGFFGGADRSGSQWPLWLLLTIAGGVCGALGALAVPSSTRL